MNGLVLHQFYELILLAPQDGGRLLREVPKLTLQVGNQVVVVRDAFHPIHFRTTFSRSFVLPLEFALYTIIEFAER